MTTEIPDSFALSLVFEIIQHMREKAHHSRTKLKSVANLSDSHDCVLCPVRAAGHCVEPSITP